MKRGKRPVFFIVAVLIAFLSFTAFFGISTQYGDKKTVYFKGANDIRWGIDIRGGVDVTFTPPDGVEATHDQMAAAETVIKSRLVAKNITDSEVYTDYSHNRIIVRFPWKEGETDFDPQAAIKELGETAELTFREGYKVDSNGKPTGVTEETVILKGSDVVKASAGVDSQTNKNVVSLELTSGAGGGAEKFAEATERIAKLSGGNNVISIWMDDTNISRASVSEKIEGGKAIISGNFTAKEAVELANKINSGALPFKLETKNFSTITATMGMGAKDAMVMAGIIAFCIICLFMIVVYRLPGFVASIALLGQMAGTIACISGYFPVFSSFTLTLPGIAGIILAIGIGVDANVIIAERIKEEVRTGKSVRAAIDLGYKRAISAVLDGNLTIIIVALVLMGAFGPPNSMLSQLFTPIFFMFGSTTVGAIYSFGFTLIVGVIMNFIMGILATKLMIRSLSGFKALNKPWLFGGKKND